MHLLGEGCQMTTTCENWFIHHYFDDTDPNDAEKWVITVDHSFHAGQLPVYERQYCRMSDVSGGYTSIDEVADKLGELAEAVDLGTKALPPWYVHKYSDGTMKTDHVFSISTNAKHCPSDAEGKPVSPGYPFNTKKLPQVSACMMAGNCPPCPR
jgi:hypothetical protein